MFFSSGSSDAIACCQAIYSSSRASVSGAAWVGVLISRRFHAK